MENELYSFYGARISKSGKRVNVTLVKDGEQNQKQWALTSIALDNSAKVKVKVEKDFAIVKIPLFTEEKSKKDDDALDF